MFRRFVQRALLGIQVGLRRENPAGFSLTEDNLGQTSRKDVIQDVLGEDEIQDVLRLAGVRSSNP